MFDEITRRSLMEKVAKTCFGVSILPYSNLLAANQVVQLLMKETGNDWHLADRLVNGQISLEEGLAPLTCSGELLSVLSLRLQRLWCSFLHIG